LTCEIRNQVGEKLTKSSQTSGFYGFFAGMTLSAETLPDDPETLKAMLIAERIRSERLAQIIKDMNRHRFGRRAEALPADQLLLGLEEVEQNEAEAAAEVEAKSPPMREEAKRKRRANRGSLPSHLPEIETTVDVESMACPCCGGHLHRIGEEVSKKLDIVPAQFRVLVVRRPKYACRACEDVVVQAPAPARVIEGGLPTEALVAHVLVSKYADHLPLYRQAQIYERQGLHLDRSTLADWVGRAAFLLAPLRERILELLRSSTKLFADETTAPVLDPGRGRTKTGQLWAYARDDRPWGGADPPAVAYVYAADRTASQPIAHLADFKGVLQVDGYAGYRALAQKGDVSLAFCWSHVRRRFYDRAVAEGSPIAHEALQRIAQLYAIEKDIRGRAPDERRAVRHERSHPIVAELEPWLRAKLSLISKKSKLAEAIRYALARWEGLCRFLDDGRIEIDSNTVERSIRPLALNRKNALFAGSDGGGDNWAVIATLIENCKLTGVEPHAYLADVLTKIVNGHLNSAIDGLLPWAYASAEPLKAVA
jgi:transposase